MRRQRQRSSSCPDKGMHRGRGIPNISGGVAWDYKEAVALHSCRTCTARCGSWRGPVRHSRCRSSGASHQRWHPCSPGGKVKQDRWCHR